MDIMSAVRDACVSGPQWLTAVLLGVCCFLPSCLPAAAGQTVDYTSVESVVSRQGDTAILR